MTEQNNVLFDLLTELRNTGNLELLPQVFGEEAERNDPNFPQPLRGREQIGRSIREVHAAFPDFELQIKHRICELDQVATEWTCSGMHTGAFQGIPPTGKRVTINGISLNRIRDNKIVEERAYFDRLALLQQLGVVSGSAQNQGIAAAHT